MKNRITFNVIITLTFFLLINLIIMPTSFAHLAEEGYFNVIDQETEEVVFSTAKSISVNDYFITQDNKQYRIIEVDAEEGEGVAEFEKEVELLESRDDILALTQGLLAQQEDRMIGMYNTHNPESYVPESGTEAKPGDGDIFPVTERFKESLEEKGIEVVHDRSHHDPIDGGAYQRSRPTAKKLAEQAPDTILDIHRDGVPDPEEYITTIDGEEVAQVRLVVGRQNPGMEANDEFAKQIKAVADEQYPGLIKDIFYADGTYNQDLSPRSMLLEFGTHTLSREQAAASTVYFADVIEQLLYGGAEGEGLQDEAAQSTGALRSVGIILAIVIIGGGILLVINAGSLQGAIDRIKNLGGLGSALGAKGKEEDDDDE
ncbi:stage II sporulation protein P [Natroniella sulfidigena]|uniref:stage II sporulation protein P n=1 Tax=Natroniella sulfidigena TaxID=723921 RepID=UPI002009F6CC|nr:stage II sporulation protein P [Natroniella sulfidigena]MCK8817755.1 stage II sporulation protein P [Natroniella sulfidigena]